MNLVKIWTSSALISIKSDNIDKQLKKNKVIVKKYIHRSVKKLILKNIFKIKVVNNNIK